MVWREAVFIVLLLLRWCLNTDRVWCLDLQLKDLFSDLKHSWTLYRRSISRQHCLVFPKTELSLELGMKCALGVNRSKGRPSTKNVWKVTFDLSGCAISGVCHKSCPFKKHKWKYSDGRHGTLDSPLATPGGGQAQWNLGLHSLPHPACPATPAGYPTSSLICLSLSPSPFLALITVLW